MQAAGVLGGLALGREAAGPDGGVLTQRGPTLSSNQHPWTQDPPSTHVCEVSPVTETPPSYTHVL